MVTRFGASADEDATGPGAEADLRDVGCKENSPAALVCTVSAGPEDVPASAGEGEVDLISTDDEATGALLSIGWFSVPPRTGDSEGFQDFLLFRGLGLLEMLSSACRFELVVDPLMVGDNVRLWRCLMAEVFVGVVAQLERSLPESLA
jgi:hypothetical protein